LQGTEHEGKCERPKTRKGPLRNCTVRSKSLLIQKNKKLRRSLMDRGWWQKKKGQDFKGRSVLGEPKCVSWVKKRGEALKSKYEGEEP